MMNDDEKTELMRRQKQASQIFKILQQKNLYPTTELIYNSIFELLIAVVLSAQATDISVNKSTVKLFKMANTPHEILALGVDKLEDYIKSIGLYKTKAKNIIELCKILVADYDSIVPDNFEGLISLPGVGRKTANVILNTAFGHQTIAVDTHIFRVANRLGIASGSTPLAVERVLMVVVPDKFKLNAHHWLILHGRYVCVARKPKCTECTINKYCDYYTLRL
jgi:endonuclease-3